MSEEASGTNSSQREVIKRQQHFRLVLLGEAAVGKTSLVTRFIREAFNEYTNSTVGASFFPGKKIVVGDRGVMFDIWDTAGQDRYDCIAPMYYRGAHAALVVYDITNRNSLEKAKYWVKKLQTQISPNVVIAIAGNKCDLDDTRSITPEEVQLYADDNCLFFMETSAKTGNNVHAVFHEIARRMPDSSNLNPGARERVELKEETKTIKRCCFV